jgi:outer membrane protein
MRLFTIGPDKVFFLPLPLGLFLILHLLSVICLQQRVLAQSIKEEIPFTADLSTCIDYALNHQPLIQQLRLNEEISRHDIGIALSDWFPQIEASAGWQQYLKLPVSLFPDFTNPSAPKREISTAVKNTSALQFSATQVIFNNDVFIAGKSARFYRLRSTQTTRESKIGLVMQVSKAFYDVLLSVARLNFLQEDHARLNKGMKDAYNQYLSGVSDKIDYQRATIALNNIKAEIQGTGEEIKAKYAYLKELMGFPSDQSLSVAYDSLKMAEESWMDTTYRVDYHNRIEYQLLLTRLSLQKSSVDYYKLGFLPSLSAYANYSMIYQNDILKDLYNRDFPNSSIGLKLAFPIFEGTRRVQQMKRASLQYREMALDTVSMKSRMNTEYVQSMASYKSNLKAFLAAQANSKIAGEVYNTVKNQYDQGIKAYLEVIVSETDLRTSRINELNALYRLLSSKLDVEYALGSISVNE